VSKEDERLAVYEQERNELAAAIVKAVQGQYIGKPPPLLTGWQERAVSAVLAAGWLPPAAVQERLDAELAAVLAHYSRALDEVYRLRKAAAYEATLLDVHLRWKSLPSTARQAMDRQAQRLYRAARGDAEQAYKAVDGRALREALLDAGAEEGLSRAQWEAGSA
jgi:hypothetical protein